jgi:hypothetical protein
MCLFGLLKASVTFVTIQYLCLVGVWTNVYVLISLSYTDTKFTQKHCMNCISLPSDVQLFLPFHVSLWLAIGEGRDRAASRFRLCATARVSYGQITVNFVLLAALFLAILAGE